MCVRTWEEIWLAQGEGPWVHAERMGRTSVRARYLSVVQGTGASHPRDALPIPTGDVQERPVAVADGAVEGSPQIAPPIHLACQMQEGQDPGHGLD